MLKNQTYNKRAAQLAKSLSMIAEVWHFHGSSRELLKVIIPAESAFKLLLRCPIPINGLARYSALMSSVGKTHGPTGCISSNSSSPLKILSMAHASLLSIQAAHSWQNALL